MKGEHLYDNDHPGVGGVVVLSMIEDLPGFVFVAYAWPYGFSQWIAHSLVLGNN